MPIMTTFGASCAPSIRATSPAVAPEKLRSCAKVVAPTMMNSSEPEIDSVPRNDFQRFLRREAAIAGGEHDGAERTKRARFGRRRPTFGHAEHHDAENQDQRRDGDKQIEPWPRDLYRLSCVGHGASARIDPAAQHHIGDEQHAQDQPRHDAADQKPGDRNAGEAAEQHRETRGRNQDIDAADRERRAPSRSWDHSRATASAAAAASPASQWWRWSSRKSPRRSCRRPALRPRAVPGTRLMTASTASTDFKASPV